jgi:hypothetical protein
LKTNHLATLVQIRVGELETKASFEGIQAAAGQSDRIGQIFAHWPIAYIGKRFLEAQNIMATFCHSQCYALVSAKKAWATYWATFYELLVKVARIYWLHFFPVSMLCITYIVLAKKAWATFLLNNAVNAEEIADRNKIKKIP